jgi:GTP-binding protein
MGKPIVAIVGRRNVGKSTLLNRLAGKRIAIVQDVPGTTRDRVFADVTWQEKEFIIVDTGGLEIGPESEIERGVRNQVNAAIGEADAIIFVTSVKEGLMPADFEIADMLRRTEKPVILVVNKADNDTLEADATEFYQLGLEDPVPISAYHARNTGELLDRIVRLLPSTLPPLSPRPEMMKIAIVGRPNVGKSALLNTLLGKERSIVSRIPGTTRDTIDTAIDIQGKNVLLIDTAGIRRRGQIEHGVERYSVMRAFRAIDRCDIALLLLDATELVTAQDTHIAGYIQQELKSVILIVNKWDLIKDKNTTRWTEAIKMIFKFIDYAPIHFISALSGQGVNGVMPTAFQVYTERLKRLSDAEVSSVVKQALALHPPPRNRARQLVIKTGSQTETNPPEFSFRVNDTKLVHFSYKRYLENQLRQAFGFIGTPIKLAFNSGGGS